MERLLANPARIGVKELSSLGQALLAMALGLIILGMVGFAEIPAIHDAMHDVRHSTGFPCH